ncbi:uncharacterized protein AKAW2_52046S [Aspergillus luchuensis]|uniref:Uncharacterized protein n=1 Tax=Aspergillus kawachii TaxID=1069201 RepID=A0A7R8A250_ASPKA|nr:uncharacterized protein AKAW2_52046S [Aspergillus luchuensis]BCS01705.1 hypothetical protein AKAW2_52046S [Aspergillus luchuensis]
MQCKNQSTASGIHPQRGRKSKTSQEKGDDPQSMLQWETRRRINNARFHCENVRLIDCLGGSLFFFPLPVCVPESQNSLELPTVVKVMLSRDNEDPLGPSVCRLQRLSLGSLAETLLLLQ